MLAHVYPNKTLFDSLQFKTEGEIDEQLYPPFPSRLLMNPNIRQGCSNSPQNDGSNVRRVRPIAVRPPPGFTPKKHIPEAFGEISSMPLSNYERLDSNRTSSSSPSILSIPNEPSYLKIVKINTIAGALDGDWSIK